MMPMETGIWCVCVWWIKKRQKIKDKRSKIKETRVVERQCGFFVLIPAIMTHFFTNQVIGKHQFVGTI